MDSCLELTQTCAMVWKIYAELPYILNQFKGNVLIASMDTTIIFALLGTEAILFGCVDNMIIHKIKELPRGLYHIFLVIAGMFCVLKCFEVIPYNSIGVCRHYNFYVDL